MTADDTVTAKLAEWEALVEGVTPGPWEAVSSEVTMNDRSEWRIGDRSRPQVLRAQMRSADAEFIAAAREMAPALLGFVEDVLRLTDEADAAARGHFGHRPCEAFARKVLADRMRAALTRRIGGA